MDKYKVFNSIWVVLLGGSLALGSAIMGVCCFMSIIGAGFGTEYFRLAKFALAPAGKEVTTDFGDDPVLNIVWLIFGGFTMSVLLFVLGLILSMTIIGIPFSKQVMKLAKFCISPFGCEIDEV